MSKEMSSVLHARARASCAPYTVKRCRHNTKNISFFLIYGFVDVCMLSLMLRPCSATTSYCCCADRHEYMKWTSLAGRGSYKLYHSLEIPLLFNANVHVSCAQMGCPPALTQHVHSQQ